MITNSEVSKLQKELHSKNRIIKALKQTRSKKEFLDCIQQWKDYVNSLKCEMDNLRNIKDQEIQKLHSRNKELLQQQENILQGAIDAQLKNRIAQIQRLRTGLKEYELKVWNVIKQSERPLYQAEIASVCDLRKNTTWYIIDKLKRKGYIATRKKDGKIFCYVKSSKNHSRNSEKNTHSNTYPNSPVCNHCSIKGGM